MQSEKFNLKYGGMESKQFGLDLDDTLKFADWDPNVGAIIEVKIPVDILNQIGDFTQVDPWIFKNGIVTIPIEKLDIFNSNIIYITKRY